MDHASYQQIGTLGKSWGNQGLITASIFEGYLGSIAADGFVFLDHDGLYVPYYIERITPKGNKLHIKLEDIVSASDADNLKSKKLYLKREEVSDIPVTPTKEIDQFVGYQIYDGDNHIGEIQSIESLPQQEMAFVSYQGSQIMIPLIDNLVNDIDDDSRVIKMSLPEGLLDI